MARNKNKRNRKMQTWIDTRKRQRLSHPQVQMARELGMNPGKLGKLDNQDQKPWKMPLREYIEHLYFKRFGKRRPEIVLSIEEKIRFSNSTVTSVRSGNLLYRIPPVFRTSVLALLMILRAKKPFWGLCQQQFEQTIR